MSDRTLASRRLVIAEDDPNGHRLVYIRHLVEFASDAGAAVTAVVTPNVRDSEQWQLNLDSVSSRIHVHLVKTIDLASLGRVTKTLGAEHTVVTDGDFLAMRLGAFGRWMGAGTLTVLLMRDPEDEVPETWKRRLVLACKALLLWRARRVAEVNIVGLRSALAQPTGDEAVALDPLERHATDADVARLRTEWQLRDDRFWYGVVGAVTARKNLPLVAQAVELAAAADGAASTGLVVGGPCQNGVLRDAGPHIERLRALGIEVVIVDRVLGPVEFDAAMQAVDCLVVAHSNEGPSAAIARAGMHGVRVVAAGAHSLARDVTRLPVASWTELDVPAMAAAMSAIRSSDVLAEPLELGTEQFCATLLRPLYQSAGWPTADAPDSH